MSNDQQSFEDFKAAMNAAVQQIIPDLKVTNAKEQVGHDDSIPFTATVTYKGQSAVAYNDGWGGGNQYDGSAEFGQLVRDIDDQFGIGTFDCAVDELLMPILEEKAWKKDVSKFKSSEKRRLKKFGARVTGFYLVTDKDAGQIQSFPVMADGSSQFDRSAAAETISVTLVQIHA